MFGRYLQLLNKNPKFNCAICQETLPSAEGPGRTPTRKCKHKVNVCSDCLCNMVTHAVKTGNFEEIKCPAAATDKCQGVLDGKGVEAFVDRETFKKDVLVRRQTLILWSKCGESCQARRKDGISIATNWGEQ
jgi:hypothetical protein